MIRFFTFLTIITLLVGQLNIATEAAQGFYPASAHVQGVEAVHGCCDMDMSTYAMDDCAKYCAQAVLADELSSLSAKPREVITQEILPLKSVLDWPTGPPPIVRHTSFEF
ncbi:hypothetical protein ATL17_2413 [Maritalea mobilis]|uniref:Uncharacterized protein n=1 Tax=Maritalea mobilis TaxID=483324 RepID=A0A4V6PX42_9HYPH|nr:hypothetical protein [Maritalea mobilis]TDQ64394.1 hypothetical protein ATL17_2413 [Maritalea mobilis]